MRTLIVAMGLAAIAATPALAQTGLARATSSNNAGTATATTTTLPSASVGGETVLTAPTPSAGQGSTVESSTVAGGGNAFGTNVTTPDATGTPAGDSSAGIGADRGVLGTGTLGPVTLVPEGNVSVIGGGVTGSRVVAVPAAGAQQAPSFAASNTPIFDQAAREGRAREAARRARGEEPRVYGIAPNTERDLTWQMPDDRIIRY